MTSDKTSAMENPVLDLFIIGGGINGTGIANDAAGRGLSIGLCEQADLASATSSASSKLIHGGLRYLEHKEFRLVREALHEREVLLSKAPHIIWPLRFILPHRQHLRPAWMLRAGLFLYDNLSPRDTLPGSKSLRFDGSSPLKPDITRGFEYSDCWVDDARLVVLNALQAQEQGGEILTRTRCISAVEKHGVWEITLENTRTGEKLTRRAKALINAAGPWVEAFIKGSTQRQSRYGINMIKGSHIVTRRINRDDRAFILQNEDKRIVFVLPWQNDYSLIGTTDQNYDGDPTHITISDEETDYLLKVVNAHFKEQLTRSDVVTSYSGVRPLCDDESDDPSAMTRDYTLSLDDSGAPMLSVFGGKITTFRRLSESAMEKIAPWFPQMGKPWTDKRTLPGGNIESREAYTEKLTRQYPFLGEARARRFASSYGTLCETFLNGVTDEAGLGENFGSGLTRAEVDYLIDHEWATQVDDILWRRTKMDMRLDEPQRKRLQEYVTSRMGDSANDMNEPTGTISPDHAFTH